MTAELGPALALNAAEIRPGLPSLPAWEAGTWWPCQVWQSLKSTVSLKLKQALTFPNAVSISTKNLAFDRGRHFFFNCEKVRHIYLT